MKYEIKPELKHLYTKSVRGKKADTNYWNRTIVSKEALQPVADFQKGEWLMYEGVRGVKFLICFKEITDDGFVVSHKSYCEDSHFSEGSSHFDIKFVCHPTDEELHDFLLGMVKAKYKEGDRVRCLYDDEIRMINHLLEPSWKIDFVEENEIWIRGLGLLVMKNGKWAEKAGKKLALYRFKNERTGTWFAQNRYYESDEQFKERLPDVKDFQRLTNTEFEV